MADGAKQDAWKLKESRLWEAYLRQRDDERRNELIEFYSGLVMSRANRIVKRKNVPEWEFDDMVSAAAIRLTKAISQFEPAKAKGYSTFIVEHIDGAMLDHLRKQDVLGQKARAKENRKTQLIERMRQDLNYCPTQEEVDQIIGKQLSRFFVPYYLSLDELLEDDVPRRELFVGGDLGDNASESIAEFLRSLDLRMSVVFYLRFVAGNSLSEIAGVMHLSIPRISQLITEGGQILQREYIDATEAAEALAN